MGIRRTNGKPRLILTSFVLALSSISPFTPVSYTHLDVYKRQAAASVSSDPVTNQQSEGAVDVIGDPDISVDYNHDRCV